MISNHCTILPESLSDTLRGGCKLAFMSRFDRLRLNPALAAFFRFVHPLFWPVLVWSLMRAGRRMREARLLNALVRVSWWGHIEIVYPGERAPDPNAYIPPLPGRPHWSDPVWSSWVPACLHTEALTLPRSPEDVRAPQSSLTAGACAPVAVCDTS